MSKTIAGTWHNENGSELRLEVGPAGRLSGRFVPGVGFGAGEPFEVTGFATGHLVTFSVCFGKYDSLTSWVGHLIDDAGAPALKTLWQMSVEVPHADRKEQRWKGIWSGADEFRPGAPPSERRKDSRIASAPLWGA
jgi:hypothetical protein